MKFFCEIRFLCLTLVLVFLVGESSSENSTIIDSIELNRFLDGSVGTTMFNVIFSFFEDKSVLLNFTETGQRKQVKEAHIFFANEKKEIMEVQIKLGEKSKLLKYSHPHQLINSRILDNAQAREMKGTIKLIPGDTLGNATRISASATVELARNITNCLSYYSLTNFAISLPDLMVLEKYKKIGVNF